MFRIFIDGYADSFLFLHSHNKPCRSPVKSPGKRADVDETAVIGRAEVAKGAAREALNALTAAASSEPHSSVLEQTVHAVHMRLETLSAHHEALIGVVNSQRAVVRRMEREHADEVSALMRRVEEAQRTAGDGDKERVLALERELTRRAKEAEARERSMAAERDDAEERCRTAQAEARAATTYAQRKAEDDAALSRRELEGARSEWMRQRAELEEALKRKDGQILDYEGRLAAREAELRRQAPALARVTALEDENRSMRTQAEDAVLETETARATAAQREKRYLAQIKLLADDWDHAQTLIASMSAVQDNMARAATRGGGDYASLVKALQQQLETAAAHNREYRRATKALIDQVHAQSGEHAALEAQLKVAQAELSRLSARQQPSPADGAKKAAAKKAQRRDPALEDTINQNIASLDSIVASLDRVQAEAEAGPEAAADSAQVEPAVAILEQVHQLSDIMDYVGELLHTGHAESVETTRMLEAERRRTRALEDQVSAILREKDDLARCVRLLENENNVAVEQLVRLQQRGGAIGGGSGSLGSRGPGGSGSSIASSTGGGTSSSVHAMLATASSAPSLTKPPPSDLLAVLGLASSSSSSSLIGGIAGAGGGPGTFSKEPSASALQPITRKTSQLFEPRVPSPLRRSSSAQDEQTFAPPTTEVDIGRTRLTRAPTSMARQVTAEDVDSEVARLRAKFKENGADLPLHRLGDFVYSLNGRKVTLGLGNGRLLVKMGGGSQPFLEFLEKTRL